MARLPQQCVVEVNNPFYRDPTPICDHVPIHRYVAVRRGEIYKPMVMRRLFSTKEGLPSGVQNRCRLGWVLLDHAAGFTGTGKSISASTLDWLDVDQQPSDDRQWRKQVEDQNWSEDCRPSLIVIPNLFGQHIYCNPLTDLADVPDDLADVIEWAISQGIRWIESYGEGQIFAQQPSQ